MVWGFALLLLLPRSLWDDLFGDVELVDGTLHDIMI